MDDADNTTHEIPARRRGEEALDPEASRKNLYLLVGLVGVGALVASLFLFGMKEQAIYSKPVDQLVSEKAKFENKPVRAEGLLVHGSLVKRESPCEYRFTIQKNGVEVPVRFAQCVVPDTFRDIPEMDVGVTVEGQLRADNSFDATSVLAKCPSKYEMKERAGRGEKMPHTAELNGT
ncbi:MAG: cytochrome c maturation protein CcmE [Polyangiaceae bacterium]